MTDNRVDNKNKLIDSIDKVERNAEIVAKKGEQIKEEAHLQKEIAAYAKQIIIHIPDDSYVSPEGWAQATERWDKTNNSFSKLISNLNASIVVNTASTATGSSGYGFPNAFVRNMSTDNQTKINEEINNINRVIESTTWNKSLEDDFRRLRLVDDKQDQKSALNLLVTAHEALLRPSGNSPDAGAVLIPIRECIHRSLADLLPLRPRQEHTSNTRGKIESICKQLSYDGFNDVGQLIYNAETLIDQLSSAKQHIMSALQIRTIYNNTTLFLKALLSSIDDNKIRGNRISNP